MALFAVELMISINLFKVAATFGNLSLFSGPTASQSRPKSPTFIITVNLALFFPPVKMVHGQKPWKVLFTELTPSEIYCVIDFLLSYLFTFIWGGGGVG